MGTERRQRQKANRQQRIQDLDKQVRRQNVTRKGMLIGLGVAALFVGLVLVAVLGGDDGGDDDPPVTTSGAVTDTAEDTAPDTVSDTGVDDSAADITG